MAVRDIATRDEPLENDPQSLSPVTITAVSAGVVLLIAIVLIERRAAQQIMPLRLFASRRRTGAYVACFLHLGAMIGLFYLIAHGAS